MDLYVILGLRHGASDVEIKRAYRRLARRHHPDINPGDREAETRFRQILEAYETLIDPDRRHRYDAGFGPEPVAGRRMAAFEGFDFTARGSDHS
ncbi:MAG: J domain-containing protein, partial [Steroidobacteraceae bacterium]